MTLEKTFKAIKILAVIGVILSLYLIWQQLAHPAFKPCNINDTVNCDAIVSGPVADTYGIPTPLVGLVGYTVIFFAAIYQKKKLALGMALFGLVFCMRVAVIEIFQLHVICPVCILCQIDMWAVAILAYLAVRKKSEVVNQDTEPAKME